MKMAKKVALLIGVSEYGEGIPSLSAPINDVEAMKRVLKNSNMGSFDTVETLTDPDPTAMRIAIQQIFANCRKDDLVLLFFSGHGITDDNNKLYLATKGTSKDFYKATSVPASFIHDVSLDSYAKRQAIILDCCYSGAFAEGWQTKSVGLKLKQELGGEGRVVLTSSTATQTSFQQEGEELSLYTQYLIEGIETGAANKNEDGKIYAHELHEYATTKVQEAKPKQKPGIIIDREGFNIILSQALVNDPELNFRKLVEKYATEGRITTAGNRILQLKQQEFGIAKERSDEIVNEVLAPYRKRLEHIAFYKEAFAEAVEQEYPITERLLNELKDLEDVLGLEDQDIAKIKREIIAEKEAQYQSRQEFQQQEREEYENKLQQYEREFSKAVEQKYPLSNSARNQINNLQQSLGIRAEDITRIEQPILAAKYQEKLKEEEAERQRKQEAERSRQLELQKQQEQKKYENKLQQYKQEFSRVIQKEYPVDEYVRNKLKSFQQSLGLRDEDVEQIEQPLIVVKESEYQQRLEAERLKREEKERLRQQQQENITSQPQPRQSEILSSKKARRSVLLGSAALGLVLIFSAFLLNPTPSPDSSDTAPKLLSDSQSLTVQPSQQTNLETPSKPTLISATTGVDYGRLQKLLETGKWEQADQETTRAMLQAAGREKESWLRTEDINKFSCEDLGIIDQLWLEFSNGKFGLSVQKDIYHNLGQARSLNERGLNFGARVGWNGALTYYDLTFNLNAPKGQLPSVAGWSGIGGAWLENGYVSRGAYGYVFSLEQRLEICNI